MAQITEELARDALSLCERGQHPPLTVWETQQLIYAWLERNQLAKLWKHHAYATLGMKRDIMSAAEIEAVQRFIGPLDA